MWFTKEWTVENMRRWIESIMEVVENFMENGQGGAMEVGKEHGGGKAKNIIQKIVAENTKWGSGSRSSRKTWRT